MKKAVLVLWHIAATLALTRLWDEFPGAVPPPPDSFIHWTLELYGAENGEDLFFVETHYMLAVSFIVVVATTFTVRWLRKRRHTR